MHKSRALSALALSSIGVQFASSVLDVSHQPLRTDLGAKDVAHGIGGDAFGGAGAGRLFDRIGNECRHGSSLGAANPNAALPAVVISRDRLGFGIRDIDHVALVDEDAARPAELGPLVDELAILIENLDAVVAAVANEQAALRVHRDRVRPVKFAGARAFLAPGLDELAVLRELHDPRVGIST